MMVTSESTALMAIRSDTRTGRPAPESPLPVNEEGASLWFVTRPNTTKSSTGTTMVPIAPSGSRRKILISIKSASKAHAASLCFLLANGVTGQFEENVLKVGKNCPEIRDSNPIFRKAVNHFGNEIVAAAANRESLVRSEERRVGKEC